MIQMYSRQNLMGSNKFWLAIFVSGVRQGQMKSLILERILDKYNSEYV